MSDNDKDHLMSHNYDGIQEFDNPLPAWWLATFFITIIFGFIYWIHYEFAGGQNQYDALKEELMQVATLKKNAPAPQDNEEDLKKLASQALVLQKGHEIFEAKCSACHGASLEGGIGPNLTDEFWIHGKGGLTDISQVVHKGVLDKGMPTWEGTMPEEDLRAVVAFVYSKKGSNPPNAKAPQGDKVVN